MDLKQSASQTYRDLQTLLRLSIAGIFIIGGLSYVFNGFIDNLKKESVNTQLKLDITKKIEEQTRGAKEEFIKTLSVVDQNDVSKEQLNKLFKERLTSLHLVLSQSTSELMALESTIENKKALYFYAQVLALFFIVFSLIYTSNPIRKQILFNHKEIEEASKEASKMAIRAKQASKSKSEFLANMSHEIRTPLNAILGFIDLLKEKENDEEKLKYIATVQNSSTTLLGIINDILDFSKIESGNLSIDKVDFNVEEEFKTLVELFRAKASEKSINLTLNMDPNMPAALYSDPLRIKQVIANLLSNALKFTPRNGKVILDIGYHDKKLEVSVQDTGIGVAKENQKNIFKAFSQAESSTTRKYGGTGLGLSISSRLVSMLGGKLKLHSDEGKGSTFAFKIEVGIGKYKKAEAHIKLESLNIDNKKVLLVEDNKANQMFMSLILKKFKLQFEIANDGLEAVSAFEKNQYDLILMDENMPNLNGIEATKRILAIEEEKGLTHTPIIALTANALKGDREKFLEAGMDEYLTKPINKEKLAETFKTFLTPKEMV